MQRLDPSGLNLDVCGRWLIQFLLNERGRGGSKVIIVSTYEPGWKPSEPLRRRLKAHHDFASQWHAHALLESAWCWRLCARHA